MQNEHVANILAREMKRFGITAARLRRHARTVGVTGVRVDQVLAGRPGWLGKWTEAGIRDWIDMIRNAWLTA